MVCLNLSSSEDTPRGNITDPALDVDERRAQEMFEDVSHIIYGFLLPSVCAFGMVGNVLNLTILTRRKLQKSFRTLEQAANLCLISLAVSDLMFCVFAFPSMFLPKDDLYSSTGVLLTYRVYCTAVINVFIMISTWLTVAMSLERYLAICHPLRQDLYLTTRRIKIVIVVTYVLSLLFNVPVLWRYQVQEVCLPPTDTQHGLLQVLDGGRTTQGSLSPRTLGSEIVKSVTDRVGAVVESLVNVTSSDVSDVMRMTITTRSRSPVTVLKGDDVDNVTATVVISAILTDTGASALTDVASSTTTGIAPQTAPEIRYEGIALSISHPTVASSAPHTPRPLGQTGAPHTPRPLGQTGAPHTPRPLGQTGASHPVAFRPSQVFLWGSSRVDTAYRVLWAVVNNVLPLLLLLFFNVCLCRNIYRSYKMRRQFRQNQHSRPGKDSSHVLTVTLVVIVVMFFILVAPSEAVIHAAVLTHSKSSYTYLSVEAVMNFMQSLNFSLNFVLYCFISPYFRKTLRYLFCCGRYNIYQARGVDRASLTSRSGYLMSWDRKVCTIHRPHSRHRDSNPHPLIKHCQRH